MFFSKGKSPASQEHADAAFPVRQLFVLAVCRICEPIAFMSIFPYIYHMVRSFKITQNEDQVAIYAGLVTSSFTFAEFLASAFWGRLSDRIGRKPVLLTGLAGTGISMILFGLAPSLQVALVARALGGILNGNIGVLQSTVAEVIKVKAHRHRAYSLMPFVWSLGSIIGAGLGGTLADPVANYPTVFRPGTIFDNYPYLLPNIVCTGVVVLGVVVGFLFLEETHEEKRHRRDRGLELGNRLLKFGCAQAFALDEKSSGTLEETLSFLANDDLSAYQSTRPSTASSSDHSFTSDSPLQTRTASDATSLASYESGKPSFRQTFTNQVMLNIIGYGILAFHTIALEQLIPILFSEPMSDAPVSLPFKFLGGLALSTKNIGFILSLQGFLQMLVQIFLFPVVSKRFGSLLLFRATISVYPIFYFLIPYLALLPQPWRPLGIFATLVVKVSAQAFSYPSLQMMLNEMAPHRVRGTLNGSAASSASLGRTFGPTVAGIIHAQGLKFGYSGLAWWAISLVAAVGFVESTCMTAVKAENPKEDMDEETGLDEPLAGPSGLSVVADDHSRHTLLSPRSSTERHLQYGSLVTADEESD